MQFLFVELFSASCSCSAAGQAGAGPLILPDNVPSKNTSQGKEKLLAALNTVDIRRPETT